MPTEDFVRNVGRRMHQIACEGIDMAMHRGTKMWIWLWRFCGSSALPASRMWWAHAATKPTSNNFFKGFLLFAADR